MVQAVVAPADRVVLVTPSAAALVLPLTVCPRSVAARPAVVPPAAVLQVVAVEALLVVVAAAEVVAGAAVAAVAVDVVAEAVAAALPIAMCSSATGSPGGRGQQFQGMVFETLGNSVLNARPSSFTSGVAVPKAGYAANRFGGSVGGPLQIPHIISLDRTFYFVNYTGNRSKNGFDDNSTVPTAAERLGDFSGISTVINNPTTGLPFTGNIIPPTMLDKAALGLFSYIPLPNAAGTRNNYQLIGANPTNNDNLQTRINQTISLKDGLDFNFNYQHRNSANIQNFGFVDPTLGYGLSSGVTYRRTISRTLINSLVWNFSRNVTQTMSAFSNGANIEGQLGILGVTAGPETYGPPTVSFANFTSLSDSTPSLTRTQTSAITDSLISIHGKHTVTYGFNYQRRQYNTVTDANARGSFTFNGVESGYDLADFLLSSPQQTTVVNYTDNSRYLRENVLAAYATDDFRLGFKLYCQHGPSVGIISCAAYREERRSGKPPARPWFNGRGLAVCPIVTATCSPRWVIRKA